MRPSSARIDDLTAAMVEEYGGVVQFAGPIVESGVNAFLAAEKALQELPLTRELGQDDGHPGAGRRCRSDHRVERERAVHLPQARLGRRRRLYRRHQAQRDELAADAGVARVLCTRPSSRRVFCNVVTGRGDVVGAELVRNPDVDKISFTGSVGVGEAIMRDGAATMKRVTLELGGKSPTILLDDADLDQAIPTALVMAFLNSGQACAAGTRLLVPKSRLDAVKRAIVDAMRAFPVGDPADPKTAVGPMVSQKQYERVQSYIRKGIEEGAEVLVGGEGHPEGLEAGYFVKPTVFVNVKNDMTIAREEIFGPVLCVIAYDSEEDAIRIANDSKYGLHAAVLGTDLQRARRVASQMRAGRVVINGMTGRSAGALGRIQVLRRWPRIRPIRDRGVSRNPGHPRVPEGEPLMSKHVAISPERSRGSPRHPGARRGLRTLRRSSRCERPDGSLHRRHPLRGVHERQGSEALAGAALARGARSGLRRPEQVRRHHALRRTEHHLHADGRPRHRRSLLPARITSRSTAESDA